LPQCNQKKRKSQRIFNGFFTNGLGDRGVGGGGSWHTPGIMRVLLLFVFTGAQPTIRAETQTKQTAPKEKLNIL